MAIPTETVYGLAAHALDQKACRKIFTAKGRPTQDPLIVHVLDLTHAEELAEFNEPARRVAQKFWPGPLTLVLPKKSCVPGIVTAGRETVAIRSPAHLLTRKLLRLARVPLAAPSANLFGYVSPTSAAHVLDGLNGKIPHVLDGGESSVGVESTILDLTHPEKPRVLRPGSITATQLEKVMRVKVLQHTAKATKSAKTGLPAPGMLSQHYSPRTRLLIKTELSDLPADTGGIFLRKPRGRTMRNVYWLSAGASLKDIAHNLYSVLRNADHGGHREIWIEALPENSNELAIAINDRIRRAAAKVGSRSHERVR